MKKRPKFLPQNYGRKRRIKARWRRPRGIDSKRRTHVAHMGAVPMIGWRSPKDSRGLHPRGMPEALIRNEKELSALKGRKCLGRIASTVGGRKRAVLAAKAKELGIELVNA